MGWLGSIIWVSASFQIIALTAGRNVLGWLGNCSGWENVRGNMSEGEISRGNYLHSFPRAGLLSGHWVTRGRIPGAGVTLSRQ